jgi:Mlc titration factor MtfA (ptsG expression regulator)
MLFSWLKNRRRRKVLAEPFPPAWRDVLQQNVGQLAWLSEEERTRLCTATRIFLAEKQFEGCGGLELTDEVRVTIAAEASILALGMDDYYFDNVQTVLVYPSEFVVPDREPIAGELLLEGESERLGEAHHRGPVILAWAEALENARRPGHGQNLVFHEFAHQLDMLNGSFDGTPAIDDVALRRRWARVMKREYDRLCAAADHRKKTLLDPYGATNEAEFFAVVTECFFDQPWDMERRHAELYALLRDYFRQHPARWPEPS